MHDSILLDRFKQTHDIIVKLSPKNTILLNYAQSDIEMIQSTNYYIGSVESKLSSVIPIDRLTPWHQKCCLINQSLNTLHATLIQCFMDKFEINILPIQSLQNSIFVHEKSKNLLNRMQTDFQKVKGQKGEKVNDLFEIHLKEYLVLYERMEFKLMEWGLCALQQQSEIIEHYQHSVQNLFHHIELIDNIKLDLQRIEGLVEVCQKAFEQLDHLHQVLPSFYQLLSEASRRKSYDKV